MISHHSISFCSEPLAVSKEDAYRLVGATKIVQRWLYWSRRAKSQGECWVVIVQEGARGRKTLIDFESLKQAYNRFKSGEQPPLLPSETGRIQL